MLIKLQTVHNKLQSIRPEGAASPEDPPLCAAAGAAGAAGLATWLLGLRPPGPAGLPEPPSGWPSRAATASYSWP
ncbi:hypothetical protein DPMN_154945 [Dreissena polymorpha]|uniref:Uncharacterized protein n=1 Tax=Dreissena polymorpha TaxID=45954 RepID=A0A9D4FN08_DREPO|nr:hypothetical protein DPMN_154945 [Dreissena polymorpha]